MDNVLMVLTDRLSRYTMIFRIKDKSSDSVNKKFEELKPSMGEKVFYQTFKSLTSDNGLEFSRLQEVHSNTYYATPYTPSERGSNENVIRIIRRFIHKSTAISSYTDDYIQFVEDVVNDYPRKLLGGYSAESVYLYNEVLSLTS
ncbi:IS30 family transposase [Ligilactobacillus equi]